MIKYNIGDIGKDIKTNKIAKIIKIYPSKINNKNHFDYRGLIPMNLAIDATGLDVY